MQGVSVVGLFLCIGAVCSQGDPPVPAGMPGGPTIKHQILRPTVSILGVLLFLKYGHFSCELKETGSLGGTESEV